VTGRIIETAADVAEGAAWLAAREPRFAAALARPDRCRCDAGRRGLGSCFG